MKDTDAQLSALQIDASRIQGEIKLAPLANLVGLNAPATAAIETQYEEIWAQDVGAMFGYH